MVLRLLITMVRGRRLRRTARSTRTTIKRQVRGRGRGRDRDRDPACTRLPVAVHTPSRFRPLHKLRGITRSTRTRRRLPLRNRRIILITTSIRRMLAHLHRISPTVPYLRAILGGIPLSDQRRHRGATNITTATQVTRMGELILPTQQLQSAQAPRTHPLGGRLRVASRRPPRTRPAEHPRARGAAAAAALRRPREVIAPSDPTRRRPSPGRGRRSQRRIKKTMRVT